MKILFLNPSAQLGGAERCIAEMCRVLSQQNMLCKVVIGEPGPLQGEAQRQGAETEVLEFPQELKAWGDSSLKGKSRGHLALGMVKQGAKALGPMCKYAKALQKIVEQWQPDIVHSHGVKMHLLSSLAQVGAARRVWHLHDFLGTRPLAGKLLRWRSGGVQLALGVSQAVADDAQQVLPSVQVQTLYNAVDTDYFSPGSGDPQRLDQLAELPPAAVGTVRIGLVAAYAKWKGHSLFLQAAAALQRRSPIPLRFYVIGGPIYATAGSQYTEEELQEVAFELNLSEQMGFVGFQSDIAWVYRSLDIVVHCSTQPEPFGRTIAEAMSCGRPVIAAETGGAAELFTSQVDAWGIPANDAEQLAESILTLATQPTLWPALSENARQTALRRFSLDRLGKELTAAYRSVIT